ncbi:MAG: hypothetical protein LWY06_17230 [Firmicutes bacterium]|nr:hypothetical protein [Bacillota bacterium]
MKKYIIAAVLVCIAALTCRIATAQETDKSVLWSEASNMTYFMAKYYNADKQVVMILGKTLENDDDVSVCLHLGQSTGIHPQNIMGLKRSGMAWKEAMKSVSFPVSKLFTDVGMYEIFGVPARFKHAYNEFKKWQGDAGYEMDLTDDDVRDLVQLRFAVQNCGMSAIEAMRKRNSGTSWTNIILSYFK